MPASPSFDNIAPVYDRLARLVFGKSIIRAQTCFLSVLPEDAQVLIIGGGTGWILTELLQKNAPRRIDYVEASARMTAMAQHRYELFKNTSASDTQVHFIQGTEQNLPPETCYDAIMTFFVLDMYEGKALEEIMQRLYKYLHTGGCWLFADFKISHNKRWWHQPLVSSMYWFFRLTCRLQNHKLPDYEQAFKQMNLAKEKEKLFFGELMASAVYQKCT